MKRIVSMALCLIALNLISTLASAADVKPAIAEFNALHFAKAKQLFTAMEKDEQQRNTADYYLGRIALATGNYADAKTYFEASVAIQPNSVDELFWLGSAASTLAQRSSMFTAPGLLSSYLQNTEAALAIDPTHLPSLVSLYQFYISAPSMMGGSPEKAEQLLPRIDAISKAHGDVARLSLLASKKEVAKAVALAQAMIVSYPGSDQALFEAGKYLSNNNRYVEAVGALEKVTVMKITIDNYLRVQGSYFEIGQASVRSKTNLDQGIAALTKALDPAIFPINNYTNWGYWRLSQLQQMKGDAVQQQQYLARLEKTGVPKDRILENEMNK